MTHTTEILVNVALVTLILVNIVAGIVLIKKTFGGRLGFRYRDNIYSQLDDLNERLTIMEVSIEALDPGNPVLDRNTAGIRQNEIRRAFRTLTAFEKEIDPKVFSRIINELNKVDPET